MRDQKPSKTRPILCLLDCFKGFHPRARCALVQMSFPAIAPHQSAQQEFVCLVISTTLVLVLQCAQDRLHRETREKRTSERTTNQIRNCFSEPNVHINLAKVPRFLPTHLQNIFSILEATVWLHCWSSLMTCGQAPQSLCYIHWICAIPAIHQLPPTLRPIYFRWKQSICLRPNKSQTNIRPHNTIPVHTRPASAL